MNNHEQYRTTPPCSIEHPSLITMLEDYDLESRPSINDPFFQRYILDPSSLADEIDAATREGMPFDGVRFEAVMHKYEPQLQEYFQKKPLQANVIVKKNSDLPNIRIAFEGITVMTDSANERHEETESNKSRERALMFSMGFYSQATVQCYTKELSKFERRRAIQSRPHPRLYLTHNMLIAAWSAHSSFAGTFAHFMIQTAYTRDRLSADLAAYTPKYARDLQTEALKALRQIRRQRISETSPDETPIQILESKLSVITDGALLTKICRKNRGLQALAQRDGFDIVTGIHTHFATVREIFKDRPELNIESLNSNVPVPLLPILSPLLAHEGIMTTLRDSSLSSLSRLIGEVLPSSHAQRFPPAAFDEIAPLRDNPNDPNVRKAADAAVRREYRSMLPQAIESCRSLTDPQKVNELTILTQLIAERVIYSTFPEYVYLKPGERFGNAENTRRTRTRIRRRGWEPLSVSGDIYRVDQNPHLTERGIESIKLQFAPYVSEKLKDGYVITLKLQNIDGHLRFYLSDLSDISILLPLKGGRIQIVPITISRSNRDLLTQFVLRHLEPIKLGRISERKVSDQVRATTVEQETQSRGKPYHIQGLKPGRKRPFYRYGETKFARFIDATEEKGFGINGDPERVWQASIRYITQLANRYGQYIWDMHTVRDADGRVEAIDSLIPRLLVAKEISYEQFKGFESAVRDRYRDREDTEPSISVQAQISIYDLKKMAANRPRPTTLHHIFQP